MKKLSLLVLVCMLLPLALVACSEGHVCEFGKDWAFDMTNHYHACTCGAKADSAAHADSNRDGACDTCGIIVSNDHVFDKGWTADETNHWHAALCGHDVVNNKEAHTANGLGACEVCGYKMTAPNVATIADALKVAKLAAGAVKTGLISKEHQVPGQSWGWYVPETSWNYTWYEFAENYMHSFDTGNRVNIYNALNKDGSVYTLEIYDEYMQVDREATAAYMDGPALHADYMADAPAFRGILALVEATYAAAKEGANFTEAVEDGVYTFSYMTVGDYALNAVEVSFTLDADAYILSDVTVSYSNYDAYTLKWDAEANDYEKDENGEYIKNYTYTTAEVDGKTVYTLNEDVEANSIDTYQVTQSVDVINDYAPEKIFPSSYKLVDAEGNAIDLATGATITLGSEYNLTFTEVQPDTVILEAAISRPVVTDADGNETWSVFASYSDGMINIGAYKVGNYIISFQLGNEKVEIPLTVSYQVPTAISASVNGMAATTATVYTDVDLVIGSSVADYCNPGFTATITSDNAAAATLAANEEDGTYTFKSATAGEYVITLVSAADEAVNATLTVTVSNPPSVNDLVVLTGAFRADLDPSWDEYGYFTFDNTAKTVSYTATYWGSEYTGSFSYTIEDGVFTATKTSGTFFTALTFDADNFVFVANAGPNGNYTLVTPAGEGEGEGGGSTGAATPVNGGTIDEPTVLANETATYSVTIAAGEKAYFLLDGFDLTSGLNVEYSSQDALANYLRGPMQQETLFGEMPLGGMGASMITFVINNTGAEEITVTFTLTFTPAE